MSYFKKFIANPGILFITMGHRGFFHWMSDEQYLKIAYQIKTGKTLDLENPKKFNEKLQWLKVNDHDPVHTTMVDKYAAKQWIADRIGEGYIVPTIGVWDSADNIDFSVFPEQFVIKCTHDSGGLVVCRDKSALDEQAARRKLNRCLKHNYYWAMREWPYKNVKPRVIAEPLLQNDDGCQLVEYNFFCFNGEPKAVMYCHGDRDKGAERHNDFFRIDGERIPLSWGYTNSENARIDLNDVFADMLEKARVLSRDTYFVRVDFYLCNGKPFIGELTFFHWSGLKPIIPDEWDYKLGEWLKLPQK